MAAPLELARRAATRPWPVLVHGATGTGKELVAEHYHACTKRSGHLVVVNCGAIAKDTVEHALFGYAKGAYTGADRESPGHFRAAEGGTIFLDEIGELPLDAQVKLLRVLQERKVMPVGTSREVPVDVRVIAATHRDLPAAVAAGAFRQDLWYRLSVCVIELPSLSERGPKEIVELARHLLARCRRPDSEAKALGVPCDAARFSKDAISALGRHDWPGNVRQLEAVICRALLRADGEEVESRHLGLIERSAKTPDGSIAACDCLAALEEHGSYGEAAKALGLAKSTFQSRLERQRRTAARTEHRTPADNTNT